MASAIDVDALVRLADVEVAVRRLALAQDVVALSRRTPEGRTVRAAYLVPHAHASLPIESVCEQLRSALGPERAPDVCVEVRSIPLTSDGIVDLAALCAVPVLLPADLDRIEASLRAVVREDLAVVEAEATEATNPLHLSDVLSGWGRRADDSSSLAQTEERQDDGVFKPAPMSYADGGLLELPAEAPLTLTAGLLRTAATRGDRAIRILQADGSETVLTYAALLAQAQRVLTGLREIGLRPGDMVMLQLPDLHEYFPTFWACLLGGIKPVTVAVPSSYDPRNSIVRKLFNTWQLLGHPRVLAASRLVSSISSLSSSLDMPGLQVVSASDLLRDEPATEFHQPRPEDVAFFQLSSGSTGVSKCIQITHGGVVCHIHGSQQALGLAASDVTLNWLPTDHVVPILMYHCKDVYLGIEAIQIPGPVVLASPLKWLDLIEQYRVTHTWAPNFGFKMVVDALSDAGDRQWDLSSLKGVVNAGEQVTLPVMRDFLARLAPFGVAPATLQPAFGMAEACTCMTYETSFSLDRSVHRFAKSSIGGRLRDAIDEEPAVTFVDCGPVVPGVEIRIADRSNVVVPERTIGRLQIRGPVVTPGYLNNDAANAEAFVGEGWFNSGDLGFMLDGHLTLTGREKELIIVNGANFYCYEIEDVASEVRGVLPTFVAACGVEDAQTGTEALAVFFVHDASADVDLDDVIKAVRTEVATRAGLRPAYVVPVERDEFPKTTSGKIQRGQLKRALLDGRFDAVLKELDVRAANANTVPDWFYRPVWIRRDAGVGSPLRPGVRLLFADDAGLAGELRSRWAEDGPAVVVRPGDGFVEIGEREFAIDPASPEHYVQLLERIESFGPLAVVVHAWLYRDVPPTVDVDTVDDDTRRGVASLLLLLQALGRRQQSSTLPLVAVSVGGSAAGSQVRLAPARAMVGALLKSAAAEYPAVSTVHVDFDGVMPATHAVAVASEATGPDQESDVAYRDGHRLVSRVDRIAFTGRAAIDDPFEQGGVYVLSGGLGGLAVEVATHLLTAYQARLLLVGRQPLVEGTAREEVYRKLERLPGEVRYAAVDIADEPALRAAVAAATGAWGRPVDGVLHLAGIFEPRPIDVETTAQLAATLRPKVQGTLALHRLVADKPGALFVTFSSVNGSFGGFGASAYAAANAFVDAFVHVQRSTLRAHCVAWTLWDEVGMSRGYGMKAAAQAQGFSVIPKTRGLQSLLAVLRRDVPHALVGLASNGRAVRSLVIGNPAARRLTAYVAGDSLSVARTAIEAVPLADQFGAPVPCDIRRVPAIPRTAAGVDRRALVDVGRGLAAPVAPRSDIERLVAGAWRDVLKHDVVGIHDNFFEIGGTSFLAGQIAGRLRATLKSDLASTEMFQFPTVATQAAFLLGDRSIETAVDVSHARGASRRDAMRRLRRSPASDSRAQS